MLKQNQVVVYPEDIVSVFPDPSLNLGSRIVINRAYKIIVNDGGQQQDYRTWQKDVAGFLSEKGIQVGSDDIMNVGLNQVISDNLNLQIIRVAQNEVTETISIPYQTIKKNDPDLLLGKTETEQAGQEGIREKRYKIRRENGQITEKTPLEDKLVKNPQDKIVRIGTKILILSSQEGISSWWNGVTASVKYRKGTLIKVTNKENGKSVTTRVGGWGPQPSTGRILDLERSAFAQIADLGEGVINVFIEEVNE